MARYKARGSIIQFKWQETAEGREFLGGILHRNRRKMFGEEINPFPILRESSFNMTRGGMKILKLEA